jgi:hypothetical protein
MYGWTLIGESPDGTLMPVGSDIANTVNWRETTEDDVKMGKLPNPPLITASKTKVEK